MKILLAEDDPTTRISVAAILETFGYEVVEASDGLQAWEILQRPDTPMLAILDWMMPGIDGTEVCQRVRAQQTLQPPYLIILTAKSNKEDLIVALNSGADEFLVKPVEPMELRARVEVGKRMLALQSSLADNIHRLQEALNQVKTLNGIIPICSYCKKIRNDQQYWQQVELYISENTDALFSHGICPACLEHNFREVMEELKKQKEES